MKSTLKDRCPACRKLWVNHDGIILTCRENRRLKMRIRRYLRAEERYGTCPSFGPEWDDAFKGLNLARKSIRESVK